MKKNIFAIANQKGGVGKTTTAVNLAFYVAHLGQKVLLVDLDPQGNATSATGVDKSQVTSGAYEVMVDGLLITQAIHASSHQNLDVLPTGPRLAGAEVELVDIAQREYLLQQGLDFVRQQYDAVIIDCPPSLGLLTINGLSAAHQLVVPVQCEYYALEGIGQLMHTFSRVTQDLNPNLEIAGAVLTMYDGRTNLAREVVQEVRKFFGERIFDTMIPRNIRLAEAPSFGQPILQYDPQCLGARSYESLAKEFVRHLKTLNGGEVLQKGA